MIPGEQIVVLILQIVLKAMEGQTAEQRKQIWDWYIEDVKWWRQLLHLEAHADPPVV